MAKNKPESFTGITLEQWHADPSNLTWTLVEPRFKMMLSVLLNESSGVYQGVVGCSEGRAFGRVEGYAHAIEVLRSLGRPATKPVKAVEATFDEPSEMSMKTNEPFD